MNERIYYLRGPNNIHKQQDGRVKETRGNPVAIIMTYVNRAEDTVSYALAVVHPKEHFVKSLAKQIVLGRLNVNPMIIHGVPETGHKITEMVMRDIFASNVVCRTVCISPRLRNLVGDWLAYAAIPKDRLPTIPAPKQSDESCLPRNRDAIPPPPMVPQMCGTAASNRQTLIDDAVAGRKHTTSPMSPREFTDRAAAKARAEAKARFTLSGASDIDLAKDLIRG